jgi:hypothetical protein
MKLEFPGVASPLGFSTAQILAFLTNLKWAVFVCRAAGDAGTFSTAWVQFRDSHLYGDAGQPIGSVPATTMPETPDVAAPPPGVIARIRAVVQQIKTSPAYTPAIGQTLRIVPTVTPVDPNPAQPDTKATPLPMFKVGLRWTARGSVGVRTRCCRDGESEPVDLGIATGNSFVDERPRWSWANRKCEPTNKLTGATTSRSANGVMPSG